jgi:lipoprotein signal peptidase
MIIVSALLWAPLQTAIATSNIFTVAFALGMGAAFCLTQDRSRLAFTIALKPTVGLPFLIYILVQRKRARVIPAAIATGLLLGCVAVIPHYGGTLWWQSFLANSQRMFAPGAIDDFSTANPLHFQLVNLSVPLFPLSQSRTLAELSAALIFVVVLIFWLFAVRRDWRLGLLDLAILASASLLPVYHRFMDAGVLLIPVAWALSELAGELRRSASACLLLASPFLLPGASVLHEFSERYQMLKKLSRTSVWESLILTHEAWLILLLCAVLISARYHSRAPAHVIT